MADLPNENGITAEDQPRPPGLLLYGVGGDYVGARRSRRAFRLCVLAALGFAAALYFHQSFLRYDLIETQYVRALTLEDDSQRAILRNVVARDQKTPTPQSQRYVEALAAIEEEDLVLARYEEAYALNPKNQSLIISFGCRLFQEGQFRRARDTFREASLLQPPRNALPRYLEAAALVAADPSETALREAISLVARANRADDPLLFPQPPWHESLSTECRWYIRKQREVVDRCCQPLYRFRNLLCDQARAAISEGRFAEWEDWLRELEFMGRRLAGPSDSDPMHYTASRVLAGLECMREAMDTRTALHTARNAAGDQAALLQLAESGLQKDITAALEQVRDFERDRERIQDDLEKLSAAPLSRATFTLAVLAGMWLVSVVLCRLAKVDRAAWAVPHRWIGVLASLAGAFTFLMLLFALSAARNAEALEQPWPHAVLGVWSAALAAWILFGAMYPFLALPRPTRVAADLPEKDGVALATARYRDALLVLARRYYAVILGSFLIVLSLWFTLHRLVYGYYPTELKLLTPGLRGAELEVLTHVWGLLH